MARIRTIKPDFYTHEGLGALSPYHRLAFAGLWNQADREGRLEDRPKRLKLDILPYDEVDFDALLAELARAKFIVRYVVDGRAYLSIPTFLEHQRPHPKEPASIIPPQPPVVAEEMNSHGEPRQDTAETDPAVESPSKKAGVSLRESWEGEVRASHASRSKPLRKPRRLRTYPPGFLRFWMAYPRKVGKQHALTAWERERLEEIADTVLATLERLTPTWTDRQFIPHPTTWLNRGGWEDDPGDIGASSAPLPDTWAPSDEAIQQAKALGFTEAELNAITDEFCTHWWGEGKPKADWDMTWLNRCIALKHGGRRR